MKSSVLILINITWIIPTSVTHATVTLLILFLLLPVTHSGHVQPTGFDPYLAMCPLKCAILQLVVCMIQAPGVIPETVF